MPKYVGLIAELRGGKGTVGDLVTELAGPRATAIMGFSDPINECLDALGLPRTRENQQTFSTWARKAFGQDVFSNALYERAIRATADIVVIHGIRRPADAPMLRKIPGFFLCSIQAPAELRYRWMVRRNERPGDAEKTYEQFLKENDAEPEQLIRTIAQEADVVIINDEDDPSFAKLRIQVRERLLPRLI
ncbi:MAG TPA: hypothetical protein VD862_04310 [Candidatus Paceibacterota bacterium]|nr:hypothetical protein [Candidatus Paceibacterota bacterium]